MANAKNPLDILTNAVALAANTINNATQPSETRDAVNIVNNTTNRAVGGMITTPKDGKYKRLPLMWKTPAYGFIQMYINPQDINIEDSKVQSSTRTKAGYVYQYAGAELTRISITGTTGSSGIEGINILERIYRSEQDSFTGIAESLERRVTTAQLQSFLNPILSSFGNQASSGVPAFNESGDLSIDGDLGTLLTSVSEEFNINMFNQPFPTLASLAANIEMYWGGVVYRGYFEKFSYRESANSPGYFEYSIMFTSYARRGVRRNFMPWHRQPNGVSDSTGQANPLSYEDPVDRFTSPQIRRTAPITRNRLPASSAPLINNRASGSEVSLSVPKAKLAGEFAAPSRRKINAFAAGSNGSSLLNDLDLNDIVE